MVKRIPLLLIGFAFCTLSMAQHVANEAPPASKTDARRGSAWTQTPILSAAGRPGADGGRPFAAQNIQSTTLLLTSSGKAAASQSLLADNARWSVKSAASGAGGFFWLTVKEQRPETILTASTSLSFPGPGYSPQEILESMSDGLDLRPLRLPERGGVRETASLPFRLSLNRQPIAHQSVLLETENGTQTTFSTNSEGIATVTFPRDFDPSKLSPDQELARVQKNYVVSATITADGLTQKTSFTGTYTPDPTRQRSLGWGAGFTVVGMLIAAPLLRTRKEKKNV